MTDRVPCRCCKGKGSEPLARVYQQTLNLLRRQRSEVNGAYLAALAGCKGEAMCNRLVVLERHGFARGRRNGRERLWQAITKGRDL